MPALREMETIAGNIHSPGIQSCQNYKCTTKLIDSINANKRVNYLPQWYE